MKPFKKLAATVLLDLKHLAIASYKSDKTLLFVF